MPVDILNPASREEWLAIRRRNIGASVAGCLLGVHDYQTAYGLWALATGAIAEDPEETPPMRRGRLLEPVALQLLAEERPDWRITPNPIPGGQYFVDRELRLGATPDAFAIDEHGRLGVVQVKSVEPSVFRRKWRDSDTGLVEPPLWIAVQAIVEARLAGAEWAAVAAMRVGFGLDLEVIPVPLHAGVFARACTAVADFWGMVVSGDPPDPDYARDGALIARLYADDDGGEIDLTADPDLPALADEDATLGATISTAEKRRKEIRATVLHKLGNAAAARIAGGSVSAKTIRRDGYTVAPSAYRRIAFKRDRAGRTGGAVVDTGVF